MNEQKIRARLIFAHANSENGDKIALKDELVLYDFAKPLANNEDYKEIRLRLGDLKEGKEIAINDLSDLVFDNMNFYDSKPDSPEVGDVWYDEESESFYLGTGIDNKFVKLSHVVNNIEDGIGKDSVQTTDKSNAGSLCFRFDSGQTHTQSKFYFLMTDEQKQKDFNVANKKFSMKLDNNFDYAGVAASLTGGVLTVQTLTATHNGAPAVPGTKGVSALAIDGDSFLFFPGYPELGTDILGEGAIALGINNKAQSNASFAEGKDTVSAGQYAHAEGRRTNAIGYSSHAEGIDTEAIGQRSHAEGDNTIAEGYGAHAQGQKTEAIGKQSHAEGVESVAKGDQSHAEGLNTYTQGQGAHSEGIRTAAVGPGAHAEGKAVTEPLGTDGKLQSWNKNAGLSIAEGEASHIEGIHTHTGPDAHAAHAEGELTEATGASAHAEGKETQAVGQASHAEGIGTIAKGIGQHVQGKYNEIDENNDYAYIVGNGNNHYERSNIHTLDWDGNSWYAGGIEAEGVIKGSGVKSPKIETSKISVTNDDNEYQTLITSEAIQTTGTIAGKELNINSKVVIDSNRNIIGQTIISQGEIKGQELNINDKATIDENGNGHFTSLTVGNDYPVLNYRGSGSVLPTDGKNGDIFKVPGAKLHSILKETIIPCKGVGSGFKAINNNFDIYEIDSIEADGYINLDSKLHTTINQMANESLTLIYFCFPDKSYFEYGVNYDGNKYFIEGYTSEFYNKFKKYRGKMNLCYELPASWGFDIQSEFNIYTTQWTLLNDILQLITSTYPVTLEELINGNEIKILEYPVAFNCSWQDPSYGSYKINKVGVMLDNTLEYPVGYWYLSLTEDSGPLDGDFQNVFENHAPSNPTLYGLNRTYRTDTKYYIYNDDADGDNWEEFGAQLGNLTEEEKGYYSTIKTVGYEDFCTYQVTETKDIITCLNEAVENEGEGANIYIMPGLYSSTSAWFVPLVDNLTFRGFGDGVIFDFPIGSNTEIQQNAQHFLKWNWENITFEKNIYICSFSLINDGAVGRSGKATNCVFNNTINIQLTGDKLVASEFENCTFNNNINISYPYSDYGNDESIKYNKCIFNIRQWSNSIVEQLYFTELKNCSLYLSSQQKQMILGASNNNFKSSNLNNNTYYLAGSETYFIPPHHIDNVMIKNSAFPWNQLAQTKLPDGDYYKVDKTTCYVNSGLEGNNNITENDLSNILELAKNYADKKIIYSTNEPSEDYILPTGTLYIVYEE